MDLTSSPDLAVALMVSGVIYVKQSSLGRGSRCSKTIAR